MCITDIRGQALTGANADTALTYSNAVSQFAIFAGDPVSTAEGLIASQPSLVMGHALKAWLFLLGSAPVAVPVAKATIEAAKALPMNHSERGHLAALDHLAAGRLHEASRVIEDVSLDNPRDLLALIAGHQLDYFTGNARMLRDRVARALPAWSPGTPGRHSVLAMYAFGLEENGQYGAAERHGRAAIAEEPRDGWARHAVAHVMEMEGRHDEGIAFMREDLPSWTTDSFIAVHNWWHLALYHLELGQIDEVLELVDGPITGMADPQMLELVDASAMLWRLHLRGVELGARWRSLTECYQRIWAPGVYAFNDLHAIMTFVGAGRRDLIQATLEAQAFAALSAGDNASFSQDVGNPLMKAIAAFGEGRYGDAVRLIRPVRAIAARFGGSNAQRDVIDLTLIEAALRAGDRSLSQALAAERIAAKHESPLAKLFARRAGGEACGECRRSTCGLATS